MTGVQLLSVLGDIHRRNNKNFQGLEIASPGSPFAIWRWYIISNVNKNACVPKTAGNFQILYMLHGYTYSSLLRKLGLIPTQHSFSTLWHFFFFFLILKWKQGILEFSDLGPKVFCCTHILFSCIFTRHLNWHPNINVTHNLEWRIFFFSSFVIVTEE